MPRKSTSKNTESQPKTASMSAKPASSADLPKSYIPVTMTGLQDYSYWWAYARKNAKTTKPNTKTFRRGRIWC